MRTLIYIIVLLFAVGCNDNNEPAPGQSGGKIDTTALQRPIQVPNQEVVLLPEAREVTMDWLAYLTAQSEIENFESYTLNDIISNATPIAEIMFSLRQTVPKDFKTNAIQTRLSVLYTKAKVIEHLAKNRSNQLEEIREIAEELPVEFNNFKIQLNELYLKTLEDFEQELENFEEETDTAAPFQRRIPPTGLNN